MAAPAGSGAVEAYSKTKTRKAAPGVYVKDFVPKASDRVMDEAALRDVASVKNTLEAAKHTDPFKSTAPRELPPGTYGGRKSRRRGGAMIKTVRELVLDLERDPSEATLRNVLSDLKESPNPVLRDTADGQERLLDLPPQADPDPMPVRVRHVIGLLLPVMRGFQYARGGRRRGGAMVKNYAELLRDLERDPTEATLRNVLSDFKGADDNPRMKDYGEEYEERLEDPLRPGETRADRVRQIIVNVTGLLRMYGRGRRRKTTRRRGGALTKPLPQLLEDLNRDPSKATLENVISDFKTSNIRYLEGRGARLEAQLREGRNRLDYLVQLAKEDIEAILGGRAGGRRRKTTRRRK